LAICFLENYSLPKANGQMPIEHLFKPMKKLPILLLVIITVSCRPLPKVTSFVDASVKMRESLRTGLSTIDQSVANNELLQVSASNKEVVAIQNQWLKEINSDSRKLQELSGTLDKTMLGISAYAKSLDNIVEAGNSGEKNGLQAHKALTDMANTIAPQVGVIVGLTQETFSKIYGQIARVKSAQTLKEIMAEAHPTIMAYDTILGKVIDQLIVYNQSVYVAKRQLLMLPTSLNRGVLDYDKELDGEIIKAYKVLTSISNFRNTKDSVSWKALKKLDTSISDEKSLDAKQTELVAQIKKVETEKTRIASAIEKLRATEKKYLDESQTIRQLFVKSKDAIHTWAENHATIQVQLDKKVLPNFQELNEILGDLKELKDKLKALN
jgi:hypothetical protein